MATGKRLWIGSIGIGLVLNVGHLFAQQPEAAVGDSGDEESVFNLAVEVELVNILTTVRDERGGYIENLRAEDFQIFEDGRPQRVAFFSDDRRIPISLGVLMDASGSMNQRLQHALQTIRELSLSLSSQDEMFLVAFDNNVDVLQTFTSDSNDIQRALRGIRAGGETAVYDAIRVGLDQMQSARNDKKILLLLSDGFDTRSRIDLDDVEDLLRRSEVVVYAIGIDDDINDPEAQRRSRYTIYHYMLSRITGITGGRAFSLFSGRNYLFDNLAYELLEEWHQQYTLSYYPGLATEPVWRNIEVTVSRPRAVIRHREGYYAAPSITTSGNTR